MFKRLMIVAIALCAMVLIASGGNADPACAVACENPTATVAAPTETVVFTPTGTEVAPTSTATLPPEATATEVPTQISPTPTLEVTNTPEPTAITPYTTKECQIDHCGGLG